MALSAITSNAISGLDTSQITALSDDQIEALFSDAAPCLIGHVMKTGTAFDVHGVMDLMRSARAEGRVRQPYRHLWLNSPNQDLMRQGRLAALQAPIIMMSQYRQAAKDRLEARLDYETNLRSEAQIASLHDKIDLLLAMAGEREDTAD